MLKLADVVKIKEYLLRPQDKPCYIEAAGIKHFDGSQYKAKLYECTDDDDFVFVDNVSEKAYNKLKADPDMREALFLKEDKGTHIELERILLSKHIKWENEVMLTKVEYPENAEPQPMKMKMFQCSVEQARIIRDALDCYRGKIKWYNSNSLGCKEMDAIDKILDQTFELAPRSLFSPEGLKTCEDENYDIETTD